ncbi:MAG: sugar phosphate isomerase/epimerase [Planctomycetes bacterium]|nr:sugar phosphate isomerase/epimerase [Planctomycetota bacterium]
MKYIMFTKHIQEYGTIPGVIAALKKAGFDGADMCVRPGYPVTPDNAGKLLPKAAKAFAEEGMTIPLVTTPGGFTDPKAKGVEKMYAACADAGVGLIKLGYWVHEYGKDYRKELKEARARMKGFTRYSRKYGVKTLVHTHSGPYMGCNASAALDVVEDCDPAEAGIFLDAGHMAICGEVFSMGLSAARRYVSCFAFKDLVRGPVDRDGPGMQPTKVVRLGDGYVDWQDVVRGIIDQRLTRLPISLHSEYGGVPAESVVDLAAVDLRYIKSVFAEAKAR